MREIQKIIHYALLAVPVNWVTICAAVAQPKAESRWTRTADLNTPHEYNACAVVEGRLYTVGGYRRAAFEEFDPKSNAWHVLPPLRTERSFPGVAAVGRKIYAAGGVGDGNGTLATVEAFDLDDRKWTNVADLPVPCNRLAAASLNGRLYAVGGMEGTGNTGALHEYDPVSGRWTPRAPMPTPRHGHCAVVVDGKILVLGGYAPEPVGIVEEWDPRTNRWNSKADMPTARGFFGAAEVNGFVFAIAGRVRGRPPVERYDVKADRWHRLDPMPTLILNRFGTGVLEGRIYVVGGEAQGERETPLRVWCYQPDLRQ